MPTPRYAIAVAAPTDGRIDALGGTTGGQAFQSIVEAYTPSTNSWATVAPMSTARAWFAAATTKRDGRVHVFGGEDPAGGFKALTTADAYDPSTNTWAALAPMPTARLNFAAAWAATDAFTSSAAPQLPQPQAWRSGRWMPTTRARTPGPLPHRWRRHATHLPSPRMPMVTSTQSAA